MWLYHRNTIITIVGLAVLFYLFLLIYSNFQEVLLSIELFNWFYSVLILTIIFISYCIRAERWHYYLERIGITINRKESYQIFLAGQSMTITPGKIGEVIKPYLVENITKTKVDITFPIVIIERLTDFAGLIFLVFVGLFAFHYNIEIIFILIIFIVIFILIIQSKMICEKILLRISDIPFLHKHMEKIRNMYDTSYILLTVKPLLYATVLSFCAWGLECVCCYFVLTGLDITSIPILSAVFIFSFSSLIGGISMLPGGLGTMEACMITLMVFCGVNIALATTTTILIRIFTLWFAVIIGVIVLHRLSLNQRRFVKI